MSNTEVDTRISTRKMTKVELSKLIGVRAEQISKNEPIMIILEPGVTNPLYIAVEELRQKKSPMLLIRAFSEWETEVFKASELRLPPLPDFPKT